MIIGIGSDLCDARRIAKVLERHGDHVFDTSVTVSEALARVVRARSS